MPAGIRLALVVVLAGTLAACERDPISPDTGPLSISLISEPIIDRQGSISIQFSQPVDPASALDPANFVVINQCTGLRVPGALRLEGNTLIFSPAQQLPFLTAVGVRIQNILTVSGRQLSQPVTFQLQTVAPEVSDVSWQRLNSPTNVSISGIDFRTRSNGFITNTAGEVYRTINGGATWAASFKNVNIPTVRDIRALRGDSIFMIGAQRVEGTSSTLATLFLSEDQAQTFRTVYAVGQANFFSLSHAERASGPPVFLMGGSVNGSLATFRYDLATDSAHVFAPGVPLEFGNHADISRDASHAVTVGFRSNSTFSVFSGVSYRSTDGGRTFTQVALPAGTRLLRGSGFLNNSIALLLGDTSTVLRLNVATGAVQSLGVANGIPQSEFDEVTGFTTVYSFTRLAVAPDNPQLVWLVGFVTRTRPGTASVTRGIIFQSRDGGQTFTRQAVEGVPEEGLAFSPLFAVRALSSDFVATGGAAGFVAVRPDDEEQVSELCAFTP